MSGRRDFRFLIAALCLSRCVLLLASASALGAQSQPLSQLDRPDWKPNSEKFEPGDYVGPAVCAKCHPDEAANQRSSAMAQAASPASHSEFLRAHPSLSFRFGQVSYQIARRGDDFIYSASDGSRSISVTLLWAFGLGEAGQTFLFQRQAFFYQSRISLYNDTQSLDLTLGAPRQRTTSLDDALGNRLTPEEARVCFSCHTTGVLRDTVRDVSRLIPGVTCEACHGPGAQHVAAMLSGHSERSFIFNPGKLTAGALVEFCGTCHRTSAQVEAMRAVGVESVRFQPYRLQNSYCWDSEDARISCLACHDPHGPRRREASSYDSQCLRCHLARRGLKSSPDRPGRPCRVSEHNCVTCHMPKYELPGGHFRFTDHMIRIVRPGEEYPN